METPVIFIVFNRPEPTQKVFERIAQVKPRKLFVIADGPRAERPKEHLLCERTRQIATSIDWPCQLETNFASHNMGCRDRVVSGLNWAFQHVEEAIVLEDDLVPDLSFFPFCQEMLARFREDSRVSMVTGFNAVQDELNTEYSYFFSRMTHIWGWATWRRSWSRYDQYLQRWPEIKDAGLLAEVFERNSEVEYWTGIFDQMHSGTGPNTWDYQWVYINFIDNMVSVVPRVNLIDNIGFGPDATHTVNLEDAPNLSRHSLSFPLSHPPSLLPLRSMDRRDADLCGFIKPKPPGLSERIIGKLRRKASAILAR